MTKRCWNWLTKVCTIHTDVLVISIRRMNPYIKQQRNIVQKIRLTFEQERNVESKKEIERSLEDWRERQA